MSDQDLIVFRAMEIYGGGFVARLAKLAYTADDDNLRRIKAAWPEYYADYEKLAKLREVTL